MSTTQIENPNGAFGYTALDDKVGQNTVTMLASGTIVKNTPVSITSTGTVIATGTSGLAIIGVASEAAVTGQTLVVVTLGVITMSAGGATTLGTPVIRSATTAGFVTSSAAPVSGTTVGFALGASSAASLTAVWVAPGTLQTI